MAVQVKLMKPPFFSKPGRLLFPLCGRLGSTEEVLPYVGASPFDPEVPKEAVPP